MRWTKNKTLLTALVANMLVILSNWLLAVLVGNGRFWGVALGYGAVLAVIMTGHLTWKDLGLSGREVRSGLLWGILAAVASSLVMFIAFLISPDIFRDSRYNQSAGSMLRAVLFTLPVGTVLLEEVVFRGMYYHFGTIVRSEKFGILLSAGLFGLWHILSARAFQSPFIYIPQLVTVSGIVVVTALAGVLFALLRHKSKSLLAPIILHWSINATAMILAYLSFRV